MSRPHKSGSSGSIPFSWENQPGIPKVAATETTTPSPDKFKLLQLAASPAAGGKSDSPRMVAADGLHLPLPPRMFQRSSPRSSSKKALREEDDPFLAAFVECTRGRRPSPERKRDGLLGSFSCTSGGGVVENAVARLSQLPQTGNRVGNGRTGR